MVHLALHTQRRFVLKPQAPVSLLVPGAVQTDPTDRQVLLVLGDQLLCLASRVSVTTSEPETFAGSFANPKVTEGAVISTCSRLGLASLPSGSWVSADSPPSSRGQSLSPAAGRDRVHLMLSAVKNPPHLCIVQPTCLVLYKDEGSSSFSSDAPSEGSLSLGRNGLRGHLSHHTNG